MVTVVGVAYRGQIPLQDIRVDFQVEAVAHPDASGFGVRKTVTLKGSLSEMEQLRLRRAAEYCPVGQLFTKGALALEDQVAYNADSAAPEAAVSLAQALQPPPATPLIFAPGAVQGRYLADTQEYADSGMLQHEGEVKLYLTCENLTRPGRWTLLAGHSSAGWMPPPVPLAYAALAASTVTTLEQLISSDAWPVSGFHVEIAPHGGGNRDQAQTNAAAGTINVRHAGRRVVLHGALDALPIQTIEAALQQDPLSASFRKGGILLSEQIVVS
ncbi:MAG: OsmC family protein [Candidatus Entotheonellia bacterium]